LPSLFAVELVGDRDYYAVICLGIFARVSMLMSFQQSGQKFLLARLDLRGQTSN
jgi:hypothetical protein